MIDVAAVRTEQDLADVRHLMRSFVAWHHERHAQDRALVDEYFDPVAFDAEVAALPGKYAPPSGRLLLARSGGEAAGCVALRDLGGNACEMKRMFVRDGMRGRGVGRALAEALVAEARGAGYSSMRLDTSVRQVEALGLYASLGFEPVEPYQELPVSLRRWLVFLERPL